MAVQESDPNQPVSSLYQGAKAADVHQDPEKQGLSPALAKRSILVALVVFAVMSAPLMLMYDRREPSDAFFAKKLVAGDDHDIVFVGDSRALYGINPAKLEGLRGYNFSFLGMGMQDKVLDHAKSLIDPNSKQKTIVVTLSRPNLSEWNQTAQHYFTYANISPFEMKNLLLFGDYAKFFKVNPDPRALGGRKGYINEYNNGFAAKIGVDAKDQTTKRDEKLAKSKATHVSPRVIDEVAKWIRGAKAEGYNVLVLRIPTSERMYKVETEKLGLDIPSLRKQMEDAGATWIDTPLYDDRMPSYDGSHLSGKSAQVFSEELSKSISQVLSR